VSGNLNSRGPSLGASARNLDLSAGNVELGWGTGVVDAELFDAEEVLARWDAGGDLDVV